MLSALSVTIEGHSSNILCSNGNVVLRMRNGNSIYVLSPDKRARFKEKHTHFLANNFFVT